MKFIKMWVSVTYSMVLVLSWSRAESISAEMGRIVGGEDTTIENHPYQASLQYLRDDVISHWCGASILSNRFLLSTAHCVPSKSADLAQLYARVGSSTYNEGGHLVKIETFKKHPKYNKLCMDYDFAIASIQQGVEFTFGPTIQPVVLADNHILDTKDVVTVSGWGVTSEHDKNSIPRNLKQVDLPVWSNLKCKLIYVFLTSRHICIGGLSKGGKSSCFGDSGSPAVQNGIQFGMVTGGNSCSKPNIPGIYGRISTVRPWIKQLTDV